jgi:hypothetical protein
MNNEIHKPFGKKEFIETFIVVIIVLFLVSICFLIPDLFPLVLLSLAVFAIAEFIALKLKKKK